MRVINPQTQRRPFATTCLSRKPAHSLTGLEEEWRQPARPPSGHQTSTTISRHAQTPSNATLVCIAVMSDIAMALSPRKQRSPRTVTILLRSPTSLLDSNTVLIDPLGRSVSLPYEHFRYWPVLIARPRYDFEGLPGQQLVARRHFAFSMNGKLDPDHVHFPYLDPERRSSRLIRHSSNCGEECRTGPALCSFEPRWPPATGSEYMGRRVYVVYDSDVSMCCNRVHYHNNVDLANYDAQLVLRGRLDGELLLEAEQHRNTLGGLEASCS